MLPVFRYFKHVWRLITEPFETLPGMDDRRRARITAIFLILSVLSIGVEQMVGGNTSFIALVILAISYFFARTRWYRIATMALLITLSFPSFLVALNLPSPDSNRILTTFSWIVLPLILSGLLYPLRTTIIFGLVNIFLLIMLPFLRDGLEFNAMWATLGFYSLAVIFIVIVHVQRDEIEDERQAELLASSNKLREQVLQKEKYAEQAQQRADQLVMLNEIGRVISSLHDLNEILNAIFEQVRRVTPLDVFFLALYDEKAGIITFPILFDNGSKWLEKPTDLQKANRIARVIQSKQPSLINRTPEQINESKKSDTRYGDRARVSASAIMSPLLIGNRIEGVISTQSYSLNAYSDENLQLLTAIAQQVVIAIENARLLEQTRQNAGYLSILNELGRVVTELKDPPDLLETIYQQVKKYLNVDAFFVDLYDQKSNTVTHPITYDNSVRYNPKPEVLKPDLFLDQFLNGSPAILILRTEKELSHTFRENEMFGDKTRASDSLMAAPIKVGERVIGAISVQSYSLSAYTEEDLNLLVGIGNQVGIAVQNAHLLEETKKNAGYLATLNELGRVVSELRDLPDLLEVIYEQVKLHLNVDAFFVGLYHPEENTVSYPIMYDEGIRYQTQPDEHTMHSYLYRLLHGDKATLILRTKEEIEAISVDRGMLCNETKKSASLLIAPLRAGEQIIGVISTQSYMMNAYTDDDLTLLVGIGNQVGVTIQNARLIEEIKQNSKHLSILNNVGQAVSKIMDPSDLLEVIYEQGRKSISLDAFFVGLYHPETNEVSFPITVDNGRRYETPPGCERKQLSKQTIKR